ncbi:hypothetical protein ACTXT7_016909 [Hymenolepis weldensis]
MEQCNSSYDEPAADSDGHPLSSDSAFFEGSNFSISHNTPTFEHHRHCFFETIPPPVPPHGAISKTEENPLQAILPPEPPERNESLQKQNYLQSRHCLIDLVSGKFHCSDKLEDTLPLYWWLKCGFLARSSRSKKLLY